MVDDVGLAQRLCGGGVGSGERHEDGVPVVAVRVLGGPYIRTISSYASRIHCPSTHSAELMPSATSAIHHWFGDNGGDG